MKDLIQHWTDTHQSVWGFPGKTPTSGAVVTNSGSPKGPMGTPIYVGVGTSTIRIGFLSEGDGIGFLIDHQAQVVSIVYVHNGVTKSRALDPLSEEQKAYYGVDFGGQFSS